MVAGRGKWVGRGGEGGEGKRRGAGSTITCMYGESEINRVSEQNPNALAGTGVKGEWELGNRTQLSCGWDCCRGLVWI